MVDKQPKTQPRKSSPKSKQDHGKTGSNVADSSKKPVAVDRPGFDQGGATGKTSAGTGLGLGTDAAENRRDRRLPGRGGNRK